MRILILLLALLALPVPAHAAEKAGVTLPGATMADSGPLVLNGLALRSVFIVDVYVGGLYLPVRQSSARKVLQADQPRVMVMHFLRDVEAEKINEAWMEGLEDNTPEASADLRARFSTLCTMMQAVKDGQQMRFVYLPGRGTEVLVAEAAKGVIPGKDFADALLSTWIGPDPGPGKGFKKDILGQ